MYMEGSTNTVSLMNITKSLTRLLLMPDQSAPPRENRTMPRQLALARKLLLQDRVESVSALKPSIVINTECLGSLECLKTAY